ncbi:hypothetical protein QBC45DRAFT_451349 [Copromyces sp. CBS 386.78]|nr:hypothetical protein QBC45DRAFT_451349 [Copromyces sp. CBS 386.78]
MYTAEEMLAEADGKMSSNDSTSKAVKLVPIPELKADLSNFDLWDHALGFHLEFYGLRDLVHHMKNQYKEGPLPEHFKTAVDWHRWQRHCLHAYSIIYSRATKVIVQGSMLLKGYNAMSHYCPHKLFKMIWEYKERLPNLAVIWATFRRLLVKTCRSEH